MIPIYDTSTTHTHIDAFLPRVGVKNIGIPGDGEGKKKKTRLNRFIESSLFRCLETFDAIPNTRLSAFIRRTYGLLGRAGEWWLYRTALA